MIRLVLAAAMPMLGLGACTMLGPDYRRAELELPAGYTAEAAATAAGAGGASGQAAASAEAQRVPADWWTLYGDAELNRLVEAARQRNADVAIALAQLQEAEAVLREARALLFPAIDLNGYGTRSQVTTLGAQPLPPSVPALRNDFRLTASTAYEIDFWGRVRRAGEAAEAQLLASAYTRDVVELSVAGATAQTYFLLRSLDAQVAVTRQSLALREETLQLVRSRARGGIASDFDLAQSESARADAAAQLSELQRQRGLVERQLGFLTGQPGLTLAAGDLRALPIPPTPPAGLPSSLLDRRPDVRAAEEALVAANARIGIARAAMMPTISLTGLYGGQSADLSDLLASGARIWSLGLAVNLPIFDAGRLAARVEQVEARQRAALAAWRRAAESAFRETAESLANVDLSVATEAELRAAVEASRRAASLARKRYEAGYSAYLEVLDAQRTQNVNDLAFIRTRQARLAYSVDLMKALGGGWPAPERNGERSASSSR
ncbi:MAG TPA: efflux transporter outer membrane subunit [Quisquiliibacterium sp.]|nr:efflux transporter outer membrane subunit [Quisquiliibacterium sp.]